MTIRVTMRHARAARLDGKPIACAPGVWTWCARHGIDPRRFVLEGVPIEECARIDDAFARRACALARAEAGLSDGSQE